MARLSNLEGDASDLQTTVDSLSANKQDTITNAPVSEGQAVLDGVLLNKIGVKDDTLLIEITGKVIKLGVNKDKIQAKLTAGVDPSEPQTSAVFDGGNKIKGLVGDRGVSLEPSANFIRVKGPPIADWSHGLTTDADHYLDTGTNSLTVRTKTNLINSASFYNASIGNVGEGDVLLHKNCTIGQDAQINGTLHTDSIVPRSASHITINNHKLTGTINASTIAPVSPDANVNIEFIACAATVSGAEWNITVTVDGHVNIVKDKSLLS